MTLSKRLVGVAVALAASVFAAAAQAAIVFNLPGPTAERASPDAFEAVFAAAPGASELSFVLRGTHTLDGDGVFDTDGTSFTDVFHLSLNGVEVLTGAFNLGGGGVNLVSLSPDGATVTTHPSIFGQGGTVDLIVPLALRDGLNTLRFAYSSVKPQGVGDEGWQIERLTVAGGAATGGIPEPGTWAVMVLGLGAAGAVLRRRQAIWG